MYNDVYIGEIVRVNITIENDNDYPVNVTVRDSTAGAIVYGGLNIPQIPPGMIAPPMPYVEFTDTVPAHGEKSFTYSLLPTLVGHYIHSATEVRTDNDVLIYLDPQTTEINCISDGVCDESIGENYITCPQDCWSGAEDGICNPIADGQCDKDCIEGLDPDCPTEKLIFDTGAPSNPYPSIAGMHIGNIIPSQDITVHKIYTYSCPGTGGHTESIELYENGTLIANGTWEDYAGDWHNVTLHNVTGAPYVRLLKGHTNGKVYYDWIPAIQLLE